MIIIPISDEDLNALSKGFKPLIKPENLILFWPLKPHSSTMPFPSGQDWIDCNCQSTNDIEGET